LESEEAKELAGLPDLLDHLFWNLEKQDFNKYSIEHRLNKTWNGQHMLAAGSAIVLDTGYYVRSSNLQVTYCYTSLNYPSRPPQAWITKSQETAEAL
jgi:hypothetical protein